MRCGVRLRWANLLQLRRPSPGLLLCWSRRGAPGAPWWTPRGAYEPLQSGERGDDEAAFYQTLASDPSVPPAIRAAFPGYYGVQEGPSATGGVARFLVMEDLTAGCAQPCIVDIKVRTTADTRVRFRGQLFGQCAV